MSVGGGPLWGLHSVGWALISGDCSLRLLALSLQDRAAYPPLAQHVSRSAERHVFSDQ